MILKASQRGGGRQLAIHLMNAKDNEHVHIHELRGFTSEDLPGAFQEAYAVSRGTRCRQFLFSLSLNPPADAKVSTEKFQAAIEAAEDKLGLTGQPRAIVFHEKDGRRHAHAVWSRIDTEKMRAVNMDFFKKKLCGLSRELYLEHGWQMPRGFVNSKERNPANYTLAEWQQAKRAGHDPKALKGMFQELWAASDSGRAFAAALKLRGYTLAEGDRRGFVAVDYQGEVYSVARYTGIKTKDVRARLGGIQELPSVTRAMIDHANRMSEMLRRHVADVEAKQKRETEKLAVRRKESVERQRRQREQLTKAHETRLATETRERINRFSHGFRGLWDRLTGKHAKIKKQNEQEALLAIQRDKAERDKLAFRQIEERQFLHRQIKQMRQEHTEQVQELHRDIGSFMQTGKEPPSKAEQSRQERGAERTRPHRRGRERDRDFEPEL